MRYLSVCSGIEAATVAWQHPLGWQSAAFAEIDKFPSSVLKHHYPEVPNVGDFTRIATVLNHADEQRQGLQGAASGGCTAANDFVGWWESGRGLCGDSAAEWGERIRPEAIDLLVGGTPCQDFSVAGLRAGLDGERGQLTIEFARLAARLRTRWLVWENVPGVLSIDGGRAFGMFLGLLGQLGYGFAYRVLDAQFFGVPQRRRRVFVVGHLGDWRRAAAVLFERHSLSGYPAPRREKGQGTSRGVEIGPSGGRFTDLNPTLDARCKDGFIRNQLGGGVLQIGGFFDSEICMSTGQAGAEIGIGIGTPLVPVGVTIHGTDGTANAASFTDIAGALRARMPGGIENSSTTAVMAISANQRGELREREVHGSLNGSKSGKQFDGVMHGMAVRRLTPRECERLQGFPDDYTKISEKTADGPRYKALGNSMAVPVMAWLGHRIQMVDDVAPAN